MSDKESVVYGLRAVTALAQHRPGDLRRVLFIKAVRNHIGPILKTTAKQRKPYREVEKDDLDRVSGTPHHEGIVAIAKPLSTKPFGTMKETLMSSRCIIAADAITNPHNTGAILRSMAWFGAAAMLTESERMTVNPAALRVAQGGAEHVPIVRCSNLARALSELAEGGVVTVAADQNAKGKLAQIRGLERVCIVLGNENQGLSSAGKRACTQQIKISGAGQVESLNVSVAAGIMLSTIFA